MPKSKKVMESMKDQYGSEKGEEVFYATANEENRDPDTWEKESEDLSKSETDSALDYLTSQSLDNSHAEYAHRHLALEDITGEEVDLKRTEGEQPDAAEGDGERLTHYQMPSQDEGFESQFSKSASEILDELIDDA